MYLCQLSRCLSYWFVYGTRGLLTQEAVLAVFGLTADSIPQNLLTFTQVLTDTAFAFLPALVCWSTFRNFGGSPVIGTVLGLMLVNSSTLSLTCGWIQERHSRWFSLVLKSNRISGINVPAFVTGIVASKFEKWLRKKVPDAIDLIADTNS